MIAHLFLRRIELYCLVSGGVGRHAFDLGDRRQLVLPVASTILADRDGQSSRPPANSCAGHRLCRYTVWANSIDTPTDSHKVHYVNQVSDALMKAIGDTISVALLAALSAA